MAVSEGRPVAHLPLVLGMLRKLEVMADINKVLPSHPDHVVSCGRGVEALVLAILDGDHALCRVGQRLEERGLLPLLQAGLQRASLTDDRLGQILDAVFAANLDKVLSTLARKALDIYAIPPPWMHQETTMLTLYGAYEGLPAPREHEAQENTASLTPRPPHGSSIDGRLERKQVLLSLGVSGEEALPLRLGIRAGQPGESMVTPVSMEEWLALGLQGVRGIVADSTAYNPRTLGLCIAKQIGLVTLVPRACAIRQELAAWGHQQGAWSVLLDQPGRTLQDAPRRWRGQSIFRRVEVEYADGHPGQEEVRFVVVHSRARVPQETKAAAMAQAKEAVQVDVHSKRVAAQRYACAADAEAAIAVYEGRALGRRCRLQPWRYHTLRYHVEGFSRRTIRERRVRPAKTDQLQVEQCYRVVVDVEAMERIEAEDDWTVLATTLGREVCTDTEILQAYHDRQSSVAPGFRWIKNPTAIPPMWLEKPERIATLAMLTVIGLLVSALIQRQVRLSLHDKHLHLPGNQGLTATPTAAEVLTLFMPVRLENTPVHHIHGVEPHHLLVCDALGLDRAWYGVQSHQEHSA